MANETSNLPIEDQLRELLSPELLLKVHSIRFPWPKDSKLYWQGVVDNLWKNNPETDRALYKVLFPVWKAMSEMPLDELLRIDLHHLLLDREGPNYPEQCTALVYLLDQTRMFFRSTDIRYTNCFFDPLAERTAASMFDDQSGGNGVPSSKSPFSKESWLARGWSFDHYAARMDWIWAALEHSELYMSKYRALTQGFTLLFRAEVETYSGEKDPYAETQVEDEKDIELLNELSKSEGPSKEKLGRDLRISDYIFPMLRMNTAHHPIIDRFGRYPYNNDQMGRDHTDAELEWMAKGRENQRVPEPLRGMIRKDVDQGTWTPLKGNPRLEQNEEVAKDEGDQ